MIYKIQGILINLSLTRFFGAIFFNFELLKVILNVVLTFYQISSPSTSKRILIKYHLTNNFHKLFYVFNYSKFGIKKYILGAYDSPKYFLGQ